MIPATTPAGLVAASDLAGFRFDNFWTLADGKYQIGFACVQGDVLKQWWGKTVTIKAAGTPFMRTPPPLPVDHYKCYKIKDLKTPAFTARNVNLADQFETKNTTVSKVTSWPAFIR